MKKSLGLSLLLSFCTLTVLSAEAKLSDNAAMKCISRDKPTRSAFLDLEQAYVMRSVSAKDFFQTFDKSATCPALRKNLQKLHGDMIARMPTPVPKTPSMEAFAPATGPEVPPAPPAPNLANDGNSTFFDSSF